jgi:hypothetical protein
LHAPLDHTDIIAFYFAKRITPLLPNAPGCADFVAMALPPKWKPLSISYHQRRDGQMKTRLLPRTIRALKLGKDGCGTVT